jgi:hypothetical protein
VCVYFRVCAYKGDRFEQTLSVASPFKFPIIAIMSVLFPLSLCRCRLLSVTVKSVVLSSTDTQEKRFFFLIRMTLKQSRHNSMHSLDIRDAI